MKKLNLALLIILIFSITSCSVRKSEVKKEEIKIELDSSSIDKEKLSENKDVNISKEVTTSIDEESKTKTTTIIPIDSSKPAEFINNKGEKIILNNSKYVEEEKQETKKENKKETSKERVIEKKEKNKEVAKKLKAKINLEDKEKITESKTYISWWWLLLFIPGVILLSGYAYYKVNPASIFFNFLKKT
jgi:hypothetical protein